MEFILEHWEAILPIILFGVEVLLRKIPKAKPLLKILSDILDKTPGLKDNQ